MVSWVQVQEAAATLGLSTRDREAEGLVDGRRVSLVFHWTDQQAYLLVHGWLEPPLDLGLKMRRREVVPVLGQSAVTTGSDDLDSEFSIEGDDPARVGDLFTPALR